MKKYSDHSRRHVEFEVGTMVFLKLTPYRQQSVTRRMCQKLTAKFYGPFEVIERIGAAAYRLRLLTTSKIHPVFHVLQLKKLMGTDHELRPLPETFSSTREFIIEPEEILETRYKKEGRLKALVKWKSLPDHENAWVLVQELSQQFPSYKLEGKLGLSDGGIDRPWRVYTRHQRKSLAAQVGTKKS